eukprot:1588529-Alexandrium_andersonii.AAC.1
MACWGVRPAGLARPRRHGVRKPRKQPGVGARSPAAPGPQPKHLGRAKASFTPARDWRNSEVQNTFEGPKRASEVQNTCGGPKHPPLVRAAAPRGQATFTPTG